MSYCHISTRRSEFAFVDGSASNIPAKTQQDEDDHGNSILRRSIGGTYSIDMWRNARLIAAFIFTECQITLPFQNEPYLFAPPMFTPQPHFSAANDTLSLQDENQGRSVTSEGSSFPSHVAYPDHVLAPHHQASTLPTASHQTSSEVLQAHRPDLQSIVCLHARPPPVIQSYHPRQGSEGTTVLVSIYSTHDLTTPPTLSISLMFGSKICHGSLTKLEPQDPYFRYVLSVEAPAFETTGWIDPDVSMYLRLEDGNGGTLATVDVGVFTYLRERSAQRQRQPLPLCSPAPSASVPRKRKFSEEQASPRSDAVKRAATDRRSNEIVPVSSAKGSRAVSDASLFQPVLSGGSHPGANGSESASVGDPTVYEEHGSGQSVNYLCSDYSPRNRQGSMRASTSGATSWPGLFGSVGPQMSRDPRPPASTFTISNLPAITPPTNGRDPLLIRTSTLQSPVGPGVASATALHTGQAFNPYAMYPHKAVLEIQGDLDSMAQDWSESEIESRRRLVQFERQQCSNTIRTSFGPVTAEDRPAQSICISCIWWEEKQECFVTSVDTIFLLESLVAVRFTVEEKNRIRRNLEGFRPLTVSKARADTETFFKVIMGFPNPKPRNIEKDVKVFPWKILTHALKKIIGKYVSLEEIDCLGIDDSY